MQGQRTCEQCGAVLTPRANEKPHRFRARRFCCRLCARHFSRLSQVAYIVEDRGYKTPCWIWQRSKTTCGYGMIRKRGTKINERAHRVYYVAAHGPVPVGLELDHLCRVPACVNPAHLEAVRQVENVRRGAVTKLSASQVRTIRGRASETPNTLAAEFGVTHQNIRHILAGRTWRDI